MRTEPKQGLFDPIRSIFDYYTTITQQESTKGRLPPRCGKDLNDVRSLQMRKFQSDDAQA